MSFPNACREPGLMLGLKRFLGRVLPVILCVCLIGLARPEAALAQSDNIMAQGFYYRAKDLHEEGRNADALPYVLRAKQSLGGTNQQLQYLHIMALAGARDYVSANRELELFFSITDKPDTAIRFANMVDRLTENEQRQLTRVMVEIMEKAEGQTAAERKAAKEAEMLASLDRILAIGRTFRNGTRTYGSYVSRSGRTINLGWVDSVDVTYPATKWISMQMGTDNITYISSYVSDERTSISIQFRRDVNSTWGFLQKWEGGTVRQRSEKKIDVGFNFVHTASGGALPVDMAELSSEVERFNRLLKEYQDMP